MVSCILGKGKLRAYLQGAPTMGALGADRSQNPYYCKAEPWVHWAL